MLKTLREYKYLLSRLVKRDFIQKYKKTTFGVIWSVISPLCEFAILMFFFLNVFGRNSEHYTTYMMSGLLMYSFYNNATVSGMQSFIGNSGILQKIKLPSWLFPLSKNISATINFFITCVILVFFMIIDNIVPSWKMLLLIFPILMLFIINMGVSLILGSMYVFFKDTQYLYHIFSRLLYFCCAIFWTPNSLEQWQQNILYINPVYDCILYVRTVIIDMEVPSLMLHGIISGYALLLLGIGILVYRSKRDKFIFYL